MYLAAAHVKLGALPHGLIGAPLFWGFAFAAIAIGLWIHEHHWQRFTCWCFAVSAACFTVAVPPLFGALAGLTASGPGLGVLAIVAGFSFLLFYLQAVRTHKKNRFFAGRAKGKAAGGGPAGVLALAGPAPSRPNRHRRIGTPVVSIITGALFVVVVGAWRLLAKNAGISAAAALHQLAASSRQVNSGQAAQAVPPSHRTGVYVTAVAVLLVIAFAMRAWDKRKKGGGKGRGGPAALPGGGRS